MSDIRRGPEQEIGSLSAGQALDQLVRNVGQEITGACMIPMNLPKKEVVRIIKQAKKWFYKHYEYSVADNYYIIPPDAFTTQKFKQTRTLKLPGAQADGSGLVYQVYGIRVQNDQRLGAMEMNDADFSIEKWIHGGINGQQAQEGDNLMYYVINAKYYDMARQIFVNPISYHYDRLTQNLKVLGENPKQGKCAILEVSETIPDYALYDDEIFTRYVVAKVKVQLGTQIMMFGYNLPGDVTINGDLIRDAGQEELTGIAEEMKEDDGVDFFFHS
jgi:hypothetical protein